ncbi:MAG: T9SS type A sorting domain-containing protein [Bacteroidota bacterium]|nr:T9SS type A sorting domain-containing protein [Bacteroidota bacterium]
MKKIFLLFCFVVLFTPKIYSQLFVENFSYPLGIELTTTAAWDAASAGGVNPIMVDVPSGVTFPLYAGSGIGPAVTILSNGEDDSASLSSRPTSGSVYSSFMINVIAVQSTGDYFFALSSTGNAFDSRVYLRPDSTGYNIGIQKATNSSIDYATQLQDFDATYLVIVKYTFVPGTINDQVSLFIFGTSSPPPVFEPTPTVGPITPVAGTDAPNLSRVILRQGSAAFAANLTVDGIYVDTVWNNAILPVELSSFTSTIDIRDVTLNWTTASELNNAGFDVERSVVNGSWSRVGNVTGNGTSTSLNSYSYTDRNLASGKYNYRLKQIDLNGNFTYYDLSNEVNIGIPTKFDLSQNYPNPFNPTTKISYDIPFDAKVSIKLFDVSGREVATLVNSIQTAGYYTIDFNGSNLASGVYFYRLTANDFVQSKRMMIVK